MVFGAMGLFSAYVAGQMYVSGRYLAALGMLVFALAWVGGPTAYYRNLSLFIEGERFGWADILGIQHSHPRADYGRADWAGSGRSRYLNFIAKDGRRMFGINALPFKSDRLLDFVRRLDAKP